MEDDQSDLLMNDQIHEEEPLSRFVVTRRWLYEDGKPKPAAFQPHNNQVSTFRTVGLSEEKIWEISDCYIRPNEGKKSLGRIDIKAKSIIDNKLKIDPDGTPHPRHANILFSDNISKDEQKLVSMKLAKASIFIPRTSPDYHAENMIISVPNDEIADS